jgi:arylsulfatase A-like enzyme
MDKSLGDLMDYIKSKGVENNTVIIFMSDNGGLSLTPPRGGAAQTQSFPVRAGKGSVYEGGIREPMIVKWPGKVMAASIATQYVIIEDFYPSILEIAGVHISRENPKIDGKSFLPILKNRAYADTARTLIWHYPNKWQAAGGPGINYFSAIRKGDWKLVYDMRNKRNELYNLKEDLSESQDLARKFPEKVRSLSSLLGHQLREWKAPMPVVKQTGQPVPWPDE